MAAHFNPNSLAARKGHGSWNQLCQSQTALSDFTYLAELWYCPKLMSSDSCSQRQGACQSQSQSTVGAGPARASAWQTWGTVPPRKQSFLTWGQDVQRRIHCSSIHLSIHSSTHSSIQSLSHSFNSSQRSALAVRPCAKCWGHRGISHYLGGVTQVSTDHDSTV